MVIHFLCEVQTDYLIIGQGISGTFLSHYLLQAGKSVMVVDDGKANSASRVASGMINPVTGRRVVRSWMIEDLLPFAEEAYEQISADVNEEIAKAVNLYTFHGNEQMSSVWRERIDEGEEYLQTADSEGWDDYFMFNHGVGITYPCMTVSLAKLLPAWRVILKQRSSLLEDTFEQDECVVSDAGVSYKGIEAKKLIFCNGVAAARSEYFKRLPFALSKGEALVVKTPDLPQTGIYKHGMNLVPMGDEMFWLGSSFEWGFKDELPSDDFLTRCKTTLDKWLKLPYEVMEHRASIRPGCIDRRPMVGLHPVHNNVGILNGMGTKGCSLAPYFAHELLQHLLYGTAINEKASVLRFEKILSKG
ncbi:MAG: FAD-binding oxidoreductase [Chitinophagales bacterium]|nr:FAD-binding oxidoreductase [Chitinophagales bacterium]